MTLTIEHTEAEGTLLHGMTRGDGSAEIVKGLGWRWGRSIGLWFIPRSRDAAPKRPLIEQTAGQLRAVGFEVEVSIDSTTGAAAQRATSLNRGTAVPVLDRVRRLRGATVPVELTEDVDA